MDSFARSILDGALKRALDVAASATALAVLSAPMAAIGLAIRVDSPGPALYRGHRIGRNGRPFRLLKFRTMFVNDGRGPSTTSQDDPRITRVGRLLRDYKLDELPQLVNVLLGDMSLVGPRPQVAWAVDRLSSEERAVLSVRPGITDWASIKFHNEGEIIASSGIADPDEAYLKLIHPEKTRLQLQYVKERSTRVDVRILFETVATLWRTRAGEGAAGRPSANKNSPPRAGEANVVSS